MSHRVPRAWVQSPGEKRSTNPLTQRRQLPAAQPEGQGQPEADFSEDDPEGVAHELENLVGDNAYDSDPLDADLKKQGVEMIAPHRKNRTRAKTQHGRRRRRHKRRWIVERFFTWIQWNRRVLIRWEYCAKNSPGFVQLAALCLCSSGYIVEIGSCRNLITARQREEYSLSRLRTLTFAACTLPIALWAFSCGDGPAEPPPRSPRPTAVTVTPATAELAALGATVQLTSLVLDQYGQVMAGAGVTWSSADASVAAVDGSGLVTAASNGTATITATAGSASGTATVTVAQMVSTVEVSPAADTVVERDTVRFEAVAADANGHAVGGAEFTWATGDISVAVVDASGLVTGTGEGEVEVTAISSGVAGRAELVVQTPEWTLSGTVSHGWADAESGPSVMTRSGSVVAAVLEVVNGPEAGRRATTDDFGRYVLESLEEALFTVRASAEGFAPVNRTMDLASDTSLAFAISRELLPPRPLTPFPDSDPEWLQMLSSDYPYAHRVANVRVFSDISPTFSEEHATHLRYVWDFFDALYAENRGAQIDAYYTSDSTVFKKVVPHCPTIFIPGARNLTACYLDYPRWFIIPYQIPDLGTQLHEIGHDFAFATWPEIEAYPWFKEGSAMYFEGGAFNGSLRVPAPLQYCTDLFQRHDQQDRLIPLGQLLRLAKVDFLADNERTYSQSCMLFNYLERREPGVLYALIQRINAGQVASNDELIATLLELAGKSVSELGEAYESYARIAGGR